MAVLVFEGTERRLVLHVLDDLVPMVEEVAAKHGVPVRRVEDVDELEIREDVEFAGADADVPPEVEEEPDGR